MAHQTGAVVDHAHDHRRDPLALAGQHFARAMMKVQMPQGVDMIDLEAAHLQALQPVARSQGASASSFGLSLAKHALCFEVAPNRGVRANRATAALEGCAQVVKVKLRRPARVLTVLQGQGVDDRWRHAGETVDAPAQTVFKGGHWVVGLAGRVVPAL